MDSYCYGTPAQPEPPKARQGATPDKESPPFTQDTSTMTESTDKSTFGESTIDLLDDFPPPSCPPTHAYAPADDANQTPNPTRLSDAILSLIQPTSSSDLAATVIATQAMACLSFYSCPDYPQKGHDFLVAWTVISLVAVTACLVLAAFALWFLLIEKGIPSLLRSLRHIVTQISASQPRLETVLLYVVFWAGVLLLLPTIELNSAR
jgi:hypothetical protein